MNKGSPFASWLWSRVSESHDKLYRHRLVKEYPNQRDAIIDDLTLYIQHAHEDARRHLRKINDISLDPLDEPPSPKFDRAERYPELFHMHTLKGYFGEIFSALIAEHFSPFDIDEWKVPAFLFRFHLTEFQNLEMLRQTGQEAKKRVGRTGDDCLAFQLNEQGNIIRILYCEAKCTASHDTNMIANAHKKVSESVIVDLPQIAEILSDYDDDQSQLWRNAILQLYFQGTHHKSERYDMVSYVCGKSPSLGNRFSWMPINKPQKEYITTRKLEAVEVHLPDVETLIRKVYSKKDALAVVVAVGYSAEEETDESL